MRNFCLVEMKKLLKILERINKYVLRNIFHIFLRNEKISIPIDALKVNKLLLLRTDRIGDMAVTSTLIRSLKKLIPGLSISIFASELNAPLIRNDPDIANIYVKKRNIIYTILQILKCRRQNFDVLINVNLNKSFSNALISHFSCPLGIKIASGYNLDYANFYNYLCKLDRNNSIPMAALLLGYLKIFGEDIKENNFKISLTIGNEGMIRSGKILEALNVKPATYILFNISSSHTNRNTTNSLVINILRGLIKVNIETLLIMSDNAQRDRLQDIYKSVNNHSVIILPRMDLETLTALIEKSIMVITPDTSLVHIACGVGIPVAAFYTRQEAFYREWLPIGVENRVIFPDGTAPVSELNPAIALRDIIGLYRNIT